MFTKRNRDSSADWREMQAFQTSNKLDILSVVQYHSSAAQGDLQYLRMYVEQNQDDSFALNAVDDNGETALHRAVRYKQPHAVEYLLSLPLINKNPRNNQGCTPIMLAILLDGDLGDDHKCVEKLLADKAVDVGLPCSTGQTPLSEAIYRNSPHVQAILDHQSMNIAEQLRFLKKQQKENNFQSDTQVESMLRSALIKAEKKPVTKAILFCAARADDLNILKRYLDEHAKDPAAINVREDVSQDTCLHAAVRTGATSFVRALLFKSQADLELRNKDGLTPLELAKQLQSNHCTSEIEEYLSRNKNGIGCQKR